MRTVTGQVRFNGIMSAPVWIILYLFSGRRDRSDKGSRHNHRDSSVSGIEAADALTR